MERAMSVEERIRRAEDIYNRRNNVHSKIILKSEKNKEKKRSVKKLFMQIFICLSIYIIFCTVTNREYIFSKEFRNEVNTFFTEKIKIAEWYSNIKGFFVDKFNGEESKKETEKMETKDEDEKNEEKVLDNNSKEKKEEKKEEKTDEAKEENIGGATEGKKDEELSEQELMEKDAKEIKNKIKFIKPIEGKISSTFGWRNPTTLSVPKYHTGLDIAAVEGTVIKSSTDGKVIMASSQGDYGKHYQIQIEDIVIVYAHCKKLYLKEGDKVKRGQEIAEVGSTGNSTGPHLHFEIRKGERKIDPQLILDF